MTDLEVVGYASDADVCGALGCHTTSPLYRVEMGRATRVLCSSCILSAGATFTRDASEGRCRNARLHERFRLRRDEPTPALTRANGIRRGLPVPSRSSGKSVTPPARGGFTPRFEWGSARSRAADVAARRAAVATIPQMGNTPAEGGEHAG
jgi:hypothetical protein